MCTGSRELRLITHARNPTLSRAHLTGDRASPVVGLSLIEGISGIIEVRSFDYRLPAFLGAL
jgi:hypothetical protein